MKIYMVRDKHTGRYFNGFGTNNGVIEDIYLAPYGHIGRIYEGRGTAAANVTRYHKSKNETEKVLYDKYQLEVVILELVEIK